MIPLLLRVVTHASAKILEELLIDHLPCAHALRISWHFFILFYFIFCVEFLDGSEQAWRDDIGDYAMVETVEGLSSWLVQLHTTLNEAFMVFCDVPEVLCTGLSSQGHLVMTSDCSLWNTTICSGRGAVRTSEWKTLTRQLWACLFEGE